MKTFKIISVAALLAAAGTPLTALASDQPGSAVDQWKEAATGGINGTPDAGQILAQANLTSGGGPLNTITGILVNNRDVDLYCVSITNPAAFSATSSPDGAGYNGLWLFDATGHGVAGWLGDGSVGHQVATLAVGSAASAAPGLFFLAVSRNDFGFGAVDQFPLNSAGASLFLTALNSSGPYGALAPDPAAAATTLDHWNSNPSPGFGLLNTNYTITLTGAGYSTTPAPGACALLGLGGLALSRRRR